MDANNQNSPQANLAKVGIPQQLLAQLITQGVLHCGQCHCLNSVAKDTIWQSLLNTSVKLEG